MDFPLGLLGYLIVGGVATYHVIVYFILGRAAREQAMEGLLRAAESAILYTVAIALPAIAALALQFYEEYMGGVVGNATSYLTPASVFAGWGAEKALGAAASTYSDAVDFAKNVLQGLYALLTGLGVVPWTQPVAFSAMNSLSPIISLDSAILVGSATYYVISMILQPTASVLAAVGAVLVAYERARPFGAGLLGFSVASTFTLAAGADALYKYFLAPLGQTGGLFSSLSALSNILSAPFGLILNQTPTFATGVVILGVIGTVMWVGSYAAAKALDELAEAVSLAE